jgi:hypothetical protein
MYFLGWTLLGLDGLDAGLQAGLGLGLGWGVLNAGIC